MDFQRGTERAEQTGLTLLTAESTGHENLKQEVTRFIPDKKLSEDGHARRCGLRKRVTV